MLITPLALLPNGRASEMRSQQLSTYVSGSPGMQPAEMFLSMKYVNWLLLGVRCVLTWL